MLWSWKNKSHSFYEAALKTCIRYISSYKYSNSTILKNYVRSHNISNEIIFLYFARPKVSRKWHIFLIIKSGKNQNIFSFHRCVYDILRKKDKKKNRTCPDCEKVVTSKLYLQGGDSPHQSNYNTFNSSTALEASSIV